jgi:hypothetical protein
LATLIETESKLVVTEDELAAERVSVPPTRL